MTSLFEETFDEPLPSRLRPDNLDEFVGQTHLVGKGKILRRLIETDSISSMIFWGPPGVGKTTLARIIASHTHSSFIDFSAVTSGIKEIREVVSNEIKDDSGKEKTKMSKKDKALLMQPIETQMNEAAKNLDFERAMEFRDILFEMKME